MSPRAAYARGADAERRVKARLEERGWLVVRSAGSKTPADLVAVRADARPALVQVKGGKGRMSRPERVVFVDFCETWNCTPVLVTRGLRFWWGADEVLAA